MSRTTHTILAGALSLGLCSSAHATGILMDALSTMGNMPNGLNNSIAAESFVADSSGIGDIEMYLSEASSTTNGSIVITIRTDNSNKPSSTIVDTIQTLSESQIPGSETLFDFYNLAINNLTSGTKYWIEVSKAPGSSSVSADTYATPVANIITGIASTGSSAGDTDYVVGTGGGTTIKAMTLCLSDNDACDSINLAAAADSFNEAVPEPATAGIIGAGLAGLSWVRWRRRNV